MDECTEKFFCDLMDLPPGERMAALETLADLSPEQREAVRELLVQADAADAYFTGMAVAETVAHGASALEKPGASCGPYRLVRKLGEGGFGVVWQAEQEKPLKRVVALKVIKAGMDSAEVLARFDAEKHALSRMDHPNIARVLDAGITDHGRPFFVMELVEGMTITRYCREKEIGMRERLRLFADVCSALNHAHQKGIIHRDIKPSNVIVTEIDGRPVAKVIDFGIAKAIEGSLTDHTLHTRVEQWIGTPAYMSPEQAGIAAGDLDTRSDIYALGVLLYELITGVAPFDSNTLLKAGYEEMRRIIREVEPPRPSVRIATAIRSKTDTESTGPANATNATVKGVSSELDWIIMKAMEKARERRYDSAAALADDVGRFLADEPVLARPPGRWYLLSKFTRRHQVAIHVASAFVLLLVGTALLSIWLALRAGDAEQVARDKLAEALAERAAKDHALDEAEAVSNLLADVLQRPQHELDGSGVTIMAALDAAAEKLESRTAMQPLRLVMLRSVLADSYERLGIHYRSLDLRMRNYHSLKERHGNDHSATCQALRKLIETAEASGESAISLEHALLERELLQNTNAQPWQIESAMRSVVRGLLGTGDHVQAIEEQNALVEYCRRVFGKGSMQETKAERELKQYEAGRDRNAGILDIQKKFSDFMERYGATHPVTVKARSQLAYALLQADLTVEAELHLQALLAITMQQYGRQDDRTLHVLRMLVQTSIKFNRTEEAARFQQVVVSAVRRRDGASAAITIQEENRLERRLFYAGLRDQYTAYTSDLLARRIEIFGKDHVNTALLLVMVEADTDEETIANMERGIRVLRENLGERNRYTAEAIMHLARKLTTIGRTREAIKLYTECGPNMLDDTWLNFETATFQYWMGDLEGYRITRNNILRYHEQSARRKIGQAEICDRAMWLGCISPLDEEWQKEALQNILDYVDEVRSGLKVEAVERFDNAHQTRIRGAVLFRLGKFAEALAAFDEAERLDNRKRLNYSNLDANSSPGWQRFFVAMIHHHLGNKTEAAAYLKLERARLSGDPPCTENPVIQYFIGGTAMLNWILHREARGLIIGE